MDINTFFLDVGGVLLTNGWDRRARSRAAKRFELNIDEINERHHLTYDTYERGKLSLDEYINRVIFFEKRKFSRDDFKDFMFRQSKALDGMLSYIQKLKNLYGLRIIAVSNEGRELNNYRIQKFKLDNIFDAFVSSSYVHFRKPDKDIFQIAIDISQVNPEKIIYIDDRPLFVEVAKSFGIHGIHHESYFSTRNHLTDLGFSID